MAQPAGSKKLGSLVTSMQYQQTFFKNQGTQNSQELLHLSTNMSQPLCLQQSNSEYQQQFDNTLYASRRNTSNSEFSQTEQTSQHINLQNSTQLPVTQPPTSTYPLQQNQQDFEQSHSTPQNFQNNYKYQFFQKENTKQPFELNIQNSCNIPVTQQSLQQQQTTQYMQQQHQQQSFHTPQNFQPLAQALEYFSFLQSMQYNLQCNNQVSNQPYLQHTQRIQPVVQQQPQPVTQSVNNLVNNHSSQPLHQPLSVMSQRNTQSSDFQKHNTYPDSFSFFQNHTPNFTMQSHPYSQPQPYNTTNIQSQSLSQPISNNIDLNSVPVQTQNFQPFSTQPYSTLVFQDNQEKQLIQVPSFDFKVQTLFDYITSNDSTIQFKFSSDSTRKMFLYQQLSPEQKYFAKDILDQYSISYEQFKQQLLQEFSPPTQDLFRQYSTRNFSSESESVQEYIRDMVRLGKQLGYDEVVICHQMYHNLPQHIRLFIPTPPSTVRQFENVVQQQVNNPGSFLLHLFKQDNPRVQEALQQKTNPKRYTTKNEKKGPWLPPDEYKRQQQEKRKQQQQQHGAHLVENGDYQDYINNGEDSDLEQFQDDLNKNSYFVYMAGSTPHPDNFSSTEKMDTNIEQESHSNPTYTHLPYQNFQNPNPPKPTSSSDPHAFDSLSKALQKEIQKQISENRDKPRGRLKNADDSSNYTTLLPSNCLDGDQRVNLTNLLNCTCVPVPMSTLFHLANISCGPGQGGSNSAVYLAATSNFEPTIIPNKTPKVSFNEQVQIFPDDFDVDIPKLVEDIKSNYQKTSYPKHVSKINPQHTIPNIKKEGYNDDDWLPSASLYYVSVTLDGHSLSSAILDIGATSLFMSRGKVESEGWQDKVKLLPMHRRKKIQTAGGIGQIMGTIQLGIEFGQHYSIQKFGVLDCSSFEGSRIHMQVERKDQNSAYFVAPQPLKPDLGSLPYSLSLYPLFPIDQKYDMIYMDPPYKYARAYNHRTLLPPYPMLSPTELALLPISQILKDRAVLLLWTDGANLPTALSLIEANKLKFINVLLVWHKVQKKDDQSSVLGQGYYTRGSCEFLLIAKKGKIGHLRNESRSVRQFIRTYEMNQEDLVLSQQRGIHSEKPKEVYNLIKQIFQTDHMNCIEIFARKPCKDNSFMDLYGNEIKGFYHEATDQRVKQTDVGVQEVLKQQVQDHIFETSRVSQLENQLQSVDPSKLTTSQHLESINPDTPPLPKSNESSFQSSSCRPPLSSPNKGSQMNRPLSSSPNKGSTIPLSSSSNLNLTPLNIYDTMGAQILTSNSIKEAQSSSSYMSAEFPHSNTIKEALNDGGIQSFMALPNGVPECEDQSMQVIVNEYHDIFTDKLSNSVSNTPPMEMKLKPFQKPRKASLKRFPKDIEQFIDQSVDEMLRDGIIEPSKSSWAQRPSIAKKANGELRFCINLIYPNQCIEKDTFLVPLVDQLYDAVQGSTYISVFDLISSFWQNRLEEKSRHLAAFVTKKGTFQYKVSCFGNKNSLQHMQRQLSNLFHDLLFNGVFVYVDDIVIYTASKEEHISLTREVFRRLRQANYKLKNSKCQIMKTYVNILGNVTNGRELFPTEKKVIKIKSLPNPETILQLQSFLGSIIQYRKFIPHFSTLVRPLYQLTQAPNEFEWTPKHSKIMQTIKDYLCSYPTLQLPDPNKKFTIRIKANTVSYAACLFQDGGNKLLHPILYISVTQSITQKKYSRLERALSLAFWAITTLEHYLHGRDFTIQTEDKYLMLVLNQSNPTLQQEMWQMSLQPFTFQIEVITSKKMQSLDILLSHTPKELRKQFDQILDEVSKAPGPTSIIEKRKEAAIKFHSKQLDQEFDFVAQFDGGCSKGIATSAYYIWKGGNSKKIQAQAVQRTQGPQTNNVAEYFALFLLAQYLSNHIGIEQRVLIQGDSLLVHNQFKRIWRCQNEELRIINTKIQDLLRPFKKLDFEHIPRNLNSHCDSMCAQYAKEIHFKDKPQIQALMVGLQNELDDILCVICSDPISHQESITCGHCGRSHHNSCLPIVQDAIIPYYCHDCYEILHDRAYNEQMIDVDPIEDFPLLDYLQNPKSLSLYPKKLHHRIQNRAKSFLLKEGALFLKRSDKLLEVPPMSKRSKIISAIHNLAGHQGIFKTTNLLQLLFYWPNLQKQVQEFIKQCPSCQLNQPNYFRTPFPKPTYKGFYPFQVMSLDLIVCPISTKGNRYILTCVCNFSKWVEAFPIADKSSTTTQKIFFSEIIARYGSPMLVRSDNGNEFTGEFKRMLTEMGIQQIFSSPYFPQSNGAIERQNRSITNCISKILFSSGMNSNEWEDKLPQALLALRCTIARSTSFSPYSVIFLREMPLPGFLGKMEPIQDEPTMEKVTHLVETKLQELKEQQPQILQHLEEMQKEIDGTMRKRDSFQSTALQVGDLVMVRNFDKQKFELNSVGPVIFTSYTNSDKSQAQVFFPNVKRYHKINISCLAPYNSSV